MKQLLLLLALLVALACTACDSSDSEPAPDDKPIHTLQVGETVKFGAYQQQSSQRDSISWVVLRVDEGKALLLSVNLLSSRPWDETGNNLTWDNCSLRQWLNHDFLNVAFSASERADIVPAALDNSDQQRYGTPAGKNTEDSVFLLSVNDFAAYVQGTRFATASPTRRALDEGAYANAQGYSAWWLRSPGMTPDSPAYLSSAGELGTRAHKATERILGIRPAIWVRN